MIKEGAPRRALATRAPFCLYICLSSSEKSALDSLRIGPSVKSVLDTYKIYEASLLLITAPNI